jgi:hypothetical protein
MQRLEVSGAVRPLYGSLGVKGFKPKGPLQTHFRSIWDCDGSDCEECAVMLYCYQAIRGHKIIFTAAILSRCDDFAAVRI